jgi:glycosyltransferase involved in cell wall biosynthesis
MASIAVLVLAYARPDLLQGALESVAAQSRQPDEVIVVDDCSPQPLREQLRPIPGLDVRFIRHDRNRGPGAAAGTLLQSSSCELVAFLNDDDAWYSEFIAECEAALTSEPGAVLAFCDHDVMDAKGTVDPVLSHVVSARWGRAGLRPGRLDYLPVLAAVTQSVPSASFALTRRWALRVELLSAGGAWWDYFVGLSAASSGASAVYVPRRLGAYRLSPAGLTAAPTSKIGSADYAVSKLRGLCWLMRQPGSRRCRTRLSLTIGQQLARALKAAARARDPASGVQSVLAVLGVNLLAPPPWPRR